MLDLFRLDRGLDNRRYLLVGVVLLVVKVALDQLLAAWVFGVSWSPFNYLVWPNDRTLRVFELSDPEQRFALTMLAVSLPFICVGVLLTLQRLRDAGESPWLVVAFFVPVVNLLLFFVLVLLPTREEVPTLTPVPESRWPQLESWRQFHRKLTRDSYWRSGLVALAITVPLAVLGILYGTVVLQSYGFSLFLGIPFTLGMVSVLLFGFSRPQPLGACLFVAATGLLVGGVVLLLVGMEGAICLIMAAPFTLVIATLGGLVGYVIQARPWLNDQTATLALVILLPGIMAAESALEPKPEVRAVVTEVVIDAPPEVVWAHVVAFPPLPEPDDWFFQTGVAYPQRAEIHGTGVGAVRHCVFSTGTFVEPIEVWDAPHLLRFRVTEQPAPLREWSPFHIHPPHLDHYLVSERGEFRLERLPDGRTRLIGTTWYTNRMWPGCYWGLWSDHIIHRVHERVLTHIRNLAEGR